MTPPRHRFVWTPLTMTTTEVAEVAFRCGLNAFAANVARFPNFPKPDPDTGLYLAEQINNWVRSRYGIVPSSPEGQIEEALARARHGARRRAVSDVQA